MNPRSNLAAVILLAASGSSPLAVAQTAGAQSVSPRSASTAATIVQMQLQAPATNPSRTNGDEAELIYKHYIEHMGHQMVRSKSTNSGTTSATANQASGY